MRQNRARELAARYVAETRAKLAADGAALVGEIQGQLSTAGSGRTYRRGSILHTASAPGESPAVDTGRLRQSITTARVGDDTLRVGTNLGYAPALEFGTRRIAPRPYMRPALARFLRDRGR